MQISCIPRCHCKCNGNSRQGVDASIIINIISRSSSSSSKRTHKYHRDLFDCPKFNLNECMTERKEPNHFMQALALWQDLCILDGNKCIISGILSNISNIFGWLSVSMRESLDLCIFWTSFLPSTHIYIYNISGIEKMVGIYMCSLECTYSLKSFSPQGSRFSWFSS